MKIRGSENIKINLSAITVSLLLSFSSMTFGQGGRRETPKPIPTKPAPKEPADRSTSRVFRPTNPHIELVRVPSGSFVMGSTRFADEKPAHRVTINYSFYMGKYEVTQTQWHSVMGTDPSKFRGCGSCPVENVSYKDAQDFITELNAIAEGYQYRLPTEAEWKYACRAGTSGDYSGDLIKMAWYGEPWTRTHPVGEKQPNAWGLADMHGNVEEWCQDWYHENYYGAPTDGSAWLTGGGNEHRVLRGGSWQVSGVFLRSANRARNAPSFRGDLEGFRVVAIARSR
jgi:formylglycine-generating enzyme required for sulfatase activity